jgi:uncharacterized OsmC-like protein
MPSVDELAEALRRARSVLQRRPEAGLQDDDPATSRWSGGTRVVASHANGTQLATDMPAELGGTGDLVTPAWVLRAGVASCATTSIVMAAALQGIALDSLEISVGSRTNACGLFDLPDADGTPVAVVPRDIHMRVQIAARGVAAERLRALVDDALRRSPNPCTVREALPIELQVEVGGM